MKDFSSLEKLSHYPVMLDQVLKICKPEKGGNFIDCTFGSGGYSNALLSFPKTKVVALDRDPHTEKYVKKTKKFYNDRFSFHSSKFSKLNEVIENRKKFDFIIFDLGISSLQIFNLDRGFSFNSKGNVDMGMGLNKISAYEVLNNFSLGTLNDIFKFLGEEKESFRIATNIVKAREKKEISSTPDLVEIIKKSKKQDFKKKINVSTKTFQAIRIFVNREFTELIEGLISATQAIKVGGKIIVITFHSIEDKIVKFFFTNYSKNKSRGSRYYPDSYREKSLFENYKNKIIRPSEKELKENNASRSAKLRFATRSQGDFFYPKEFKKKFMHYIDLENRHV
tara:strand:- start:10 stop:1023 length:1014 start_codon:yes stop_codon:yes gene_type:complete